MKIHSLNEARQCLAAAVLWLQDNLPEAKHEIAAVTEAIKSLAPTPIQRQLYSPYFTQGAVPKANHDE